MKTKLPPTWICRCQSAAGRRFTALPCRRNDRPAGAREGSRVLEWHRSGYQTAFLAEFSKEVYTIERFQEFTEKARIRLNALGYANVFFRTGDGSEGWPEYAPFDRIIVTAAAGAMPDALVGQLGAGGRMLVPVGNPGLQVLKLVTKDTNGDISIRMLRWSDLSK
jgi:protein-L-isoaspartate(D-aspartate) O-methyltransferase